jgi:ribosome-binding protein aMBF1 (putative translation factor)
VFGVNLLLICVRILLFVPGRRLAVGSLSSHKLGRSYQRSSPAIRGWLDWSQEGLAKRAHVSLSTVRDFEKGRRAPIANNLAAMRLAINAAGVQLVERKGKPVGIAITDDPTDTEGD